MGLLPRFWGPTYHKCRPDLATIHAYSCWFNLIYVVHSSHYIFILSHGKLQVRGPKRMCGRLEATSLCHPGADCRGGRLGFSIGCHNVPHGRVPFSTYSLEKPFRLQTMLSIALGFPQESRAAKSSKRQNVTWETETRRKQVHGQLQEMCLNPPGPMEDLWNAVDPSPRNIFPLELLSTSPQPKKKSATIRYIFVSPKDGTEKWSSALGQSSGRDPWLGRRDNFFNRNCMETLETLNVPNVLSNP